MSSTRLVNVDERPIRPDHALVGREGSSVDREYQDEASSEIMEVKAHPFGVLLNFRTEKGESVTHPAFSEDAVRDICARVLGKLPMNVRRLNNYDFVVGFTEDDHLTVFTHELGRQINWFDQRLLIDAHIATFDTLSCISRMREEARRV